MNGSPRWKLLLVLALCPLLALTRATTVWPQSKEKPAELTAEQKAKLKERNELAKKVDDLLVAGKFTEAEESAQSLLKLSTAIDGEKHWRTVDAQLRLTS